MNQDSATALQASIAMASGHPLATNGQLSPAAHPDKLLSFCGVDYTHCGTADGGDLYLTRFGLPVREFLRPENWYERHWFTATRERLPGTSAIFRVPTHTVHGMRLDLVVRFSRVGQDVPLDLPTLYENPNAEFNSPFEEFALVMQLRDVAWRGSEPPILTKTPLAIYSPAEQLPLWRSGRLQDKIARKLAQHPEAPLEIARPYLLLYAWIEGTNAIELSDRLGLAGGKRERFLSETTLRVIAQLQQHQFRVIDMKPDHIIFPQSYDLTALDEFAQPYALVDYELLERCAAPQL